MSYGRYRSTPLDNPGSSGITWILIAVGGYFVLKSMGIDPLAGLFGGTATVAGNSNPTTTTTSTTTTGTTTNANNTTNTNTQGTTNTTNTTAAQSVLTQIQNTMAQYGQNPSFAYSVDQFNYYYQMVTGKAGPAPEVLFPANDRNSTYAISAWWNAMVGQGFGGFQNNFGYGFGGLGLIAKTNPFAPGVGRGLVPQGSETFIKILNN